MKTEYQCRYYAFADSQKIIEYANENKEGWKLISVCQAIEPNGEYGGTYCLSAFFGREIPEPVTKNFVEQARRQVG